MVDLPDIGSRRQGKLSWEAIAAIGALIAAIATVGINWGAVSNRLETMERRVTGIDATLAETRDTVIRIEAGLGLERHKR